MVKKKMPIYWQRTTLSTTVNKFPLLKIVIRINQRNQFAGLNWVASIGLLISIFVMVSSPGPNPVVA